MALDSIQPKTSKITGGVIFDIFGSGFNEPQTETLIGSGNSTDTSSSGGVVDYLSPDGAMLSLPATINERASILLSEIFNESFDLELFFSKTIRSFPLVHDAKSLGFELIDQGNILNKVRIFLEYKNQYGYQLVVETWNGVTLVERDERAFDPHDIDTFRVKACGKYIHGFVKTQGQYLNFGKSAELTGTSYTVSLFTESPQTGTTVESEIQVDKVLMHRLASFAGYPMNENSWLDEHINATTTAGELSTGDIIVSTAAGTNYKLVDEVVYSKGVGAAFITRKFDTVQAITNEFVDPSREKLFSSNSGFKWDEGFLLSESNKNNNLFVPSLWDPTTGNIPRSFFQSGTGPFDALEFKGIKRVIAEEKELWHAQINHGTYYVANVPYYLFSDESIIQNLGELLTEDGRSYQPLLYRPKIGIPIIASSLGEDSVTGRIIERSRLQKRGKFSGKVLNGTELDTSDPENIDENKEQFIVVYNENNEVKNWRVPISSPVAGLYKFQLPKVPLKEFSIIFSRKDIFKEEKTIAQKYGEAQYSTFQYGEGVTNVGDYAVDFNTGEVEVIIDWSYTDMGFVSFVWDYPAVVEFNKDYTEDKGSNITSPTFSDLKSFDDLGASNGEPGQKFRLFDFPIIDTSSFALVDSVSFRLYLYDEFDNSFDGSWQRVKDVSQYGATDKVYQITSSDGLVKFGDGANGAIPGKYLKVLAGYKPTLKIQFEPRSSNDYWSGKAVDLNLTKQNLNSGFLYISRKDLVPATIDLEFANGNINVFETTELNAVVFNEDDEVVPGAIVNFEILSGSGTLQEDSFFSDADGRASTVYTPSPKLEDVGVKVDLYEAGVDENTLGAAISSAYQDKNGIPFRTLRANELIQGDINEIYLFRILDDGDDFLPYNRETRRGGRLVVYHDNVEPIKGTLITGNTIEFDQQLPQSFDEFSPNYEPDLRGFYIIGKKTIQARAFIEVEEIKVYSDIVSLTVEYSPLQRGVWTLPTPPIDFESSQIDTATYISID